MNNPPPGYDDQSIIPKERLNLLANDFEKELKKIEGYLNEGLPGQFQPGKNLKLHLISMNYAAKELGEDSCIEIIESLTHAYHLFESHANLANLNEVLGCIKKLKLSLSS